MWSVWARQCREFRPALAVMATQELAESLSQEIADLPVSVRWGREGLLAAASMPEAELVITAVVGMVGLEPTWLHSCGQAHRPGQ